MSTRKRTASADDDDPYGEDGCCRACGQKKPRTGWTLDDNQGHATASASELVVRFNP